MSSSINPLAIIVAALANVILGVIWYAPRVFGDKWLALIGKTRDELGGPIRPMMLSGLASLVLAYTLALLISAMEMNSFAEGLLFGFLVGAGIFAAALAPLAVSAGRPRLLFMINAGYVVVGMMVMGAILASWR